ncbi:hypothetical protein TDB9533_01246 [Thalassocella blandensis]|nr:hypothetical protein TDB9533_01246 [Thalassocella blandensis]
MTFKMNKTHFTRAKHLLRAWGEYKRCEWREASPNGLQKPGLYKSLGDMSEFQDATVDRTANVMLLLREKDLKRYRVAVWHYVDRKPVPEERKAMKRFYYDLRKVEEFVFRAVCPEIIELELLHENRAERERRLQIAEYDWDQDAVITTGRKHCKRQLMRVLVKRI